MSKMMDFKISQAAANYRFPSLSSNQHFGFSSVADDHDFSFI